MGKMPVQTCREIGSRLWVTFTRPLYLYKASIGSVLLFAHQPRMYCTRSLTEWSSPQTPSLAGQLPS